MNRRCFRSCVCISAWEESYLLELYSAASGVEPHGEVDLRVVDEEEGVFVLLFFIPGLECPV